MSQSTGGRAAILFILVGGLGVGTLAYYVRTTPEAVRVPDVLRTPDKRKSGNSAIAPRHTDPVEPHEATKPLKRDTVRLPVFGDEISDMALDTKESAVPAGQDAMQFVALRVAEASHIDGAKVLNVDVRDHVAFVDYNAAVQKGMGSMEEGAFARALQVGFGQFTDIDKVAIVADGEPFQSGHFDFSEPLPVVRPGEKALPEPDPKHAEP